MELSILLAVVFGGITGQFGYKILTHFLKLPKSDRELYNRLTDTSRDLVNDLGSFDVDLTDISDSLSKLDEVLADIKYSEMDNYSL